MPDAHIVPTGGRGKKSKISSVQLCDDRMMNYVLFDAKKLQIAKFEVFQLQNNQF